MTDLNSCGSQEVSFRQPEEVYHSHGMRNSLLVAVQINRIDERFNLRVEKGFMTTTCSCQQGRQATIGTTESAISRRTRLVAIVDAALLFVQEDQGEDEDYRGRGTSAWKTESQDGNSGNEGERGRKRARKN